MTGAAERLELGDLPEHINHLVEATTDVWGTLAEYIPESPDALVAILAVLDFAEATGFACEEGLQGEDDDGEAAIAGITLALAVVHDWINRMGPVERPWRGRVKDD